MQRVSRSEYEALGPDRGFDTSHAAKSLLLIGLVIVQQAMAKMAPSNPGGKCRLPTGFNQTMIGFMTSERSQ